MRNDEIPFGTRLEHLEKEHSIRAGLENKTGSSKFLRLLTTSDAPYTFQETGNFSNNTSSKGFYSSYNPEVGIQTAAVLGGILAFLVVYVIYRTKCRKHLLKAIQNCAMTLFPEEYAQEHGADFLPRDRHRIQDGSGRNKENAKVVWQGETEFKTCDETGKCKIKVTCPSSGDNDTCEHVCNEKVHVCQGQNGEESDANEVQLKLPEFEEDTEQATAQWVQNVKVLGPKDQQISGIILKIPPDLVHKSYRTRGQFLSASDYIDCDGFINISSRNKSLPLLLESQRGLSQYTHSKANETGSDTASLSPEESTSDDPQPNQLHIQHQSGTRVPLDICPIIKIQQYHSRSKRRLTSLCRTSSEESMTSDTSGDPLLVQKPPETSNLQTHVLLSSDVISGNHVGEIIGKNNVQKIYRNSHSGGFHETKL